MKSSGGGNFTEKSSNFNSRYDNHADDMVHYSGSPEPLILDPGKLEEASVKLPPQTSMQMTNQNQISISELRRTSELLSQESKDKANNMLITEFN